jgi:hypothetical protein
MLWDNSVDRFLWLTLVAGNQAALAVAKWLIYLLDYPCVLNKRSLLTVCLYNMSFCVTVRWCACAVCVCRRNTLTLQSGIGGNVAGR